MAGFSVSVWLAIGSTLYPPSAETIGILQSYVGKCGSDNLTLTAAPPQDLKAVSILHHNSGQGWVKKQTNNNKKTGQSSKVRVWHGYLGLKKFTRNNQDICLPSVNSRGLQYFYSFSYLYFGAMATTTVVLVGLVVSYVNGEMRHEKSVDAQWHIFAKLINSELQRCPYIKKMNFLYSLVWYQESWIWIILLRH